MRDINFDINIVMYNSVTKILSAISESPCVTICQYELQVLCSELCKKQTNFSPFLCSTYPRVVLGNFSKKDSFSEKQKKVH